MISESEKVELLNEWRKGNLEARDKLIKAHLGLVISIARRKHRKVRDMEAVAALALVQAVHNAKDLKHDQITAYISSVVQKRCIAYYMQHKYLVVISRYLAKKLTVQLNQVPLDDIPMKMDDPDLDLEIKDIVKKLDLQDRDRSILLLRLEGLTKCDIARMLKTSKQVIAYRLKLIGEKYMRFKKETAI